MLEICVPQAHSAVMSETRAKILSDITGLLTGAGVVVQAARTELEQAIAARLDALLADKGLVRREEFEAVRAMAVLARQENESLRAELAALKRKTPRKAPVKTPKKVVAKTKPKTAKTPRKIPRKIVGKTAGKVSRRGKKPKN